MEIREFEAVIPQKETVRPPDWMKSWPAVRRIQLHILERTCPGEHEQLKRVEVVRLVLAKMVCGTNFPFPGKQCRLKGLQVQRVPG